MRTTLGLPKETLEKARRAARLRRKTETVTKVSSVWRIPRPSGIEWRMPATNSRRGHPAALVDLSIAVTRHDSGDRLVTRDRDFRAIVIPVEVEIF